MSKMNRPEILSKKEFKEICQGKDVHIIGCTNLKSGDKHKENGLYIGGEYYRKVKKTKFNRIAGYIDVGEKQDSGDDYVRYVKFNPLFVIIPLILAVLIALILYINAGNKIRPIGEILDLENTHAISDTATNSMDYISIPGFSSDINVSDSIPGIALKNPDVNQWYIYYEVREGKDILCKTKLIAPGQQKDFNAFEKLKSGDHTVTILAYAASEKGYTTGEPIATQTVKVHVS